MEGGMGGGFGLRVGGLWHWRSYERKRVVGGTLAVTGSA